MLEGSCSIQINRERAREKKKTERCKNSEAYVRSKRDTKRERKGEADRQTKMKKNEKQ